MEDFVSEATLIDAIIAGDVDALAVLFERYKHLVYRVAYRITRSHHDASDVTQEAFLKIVRSTSPFRRESNIETWIYRIAVNTALNHLRKRERRREEPLERVPDRLESLIDSRNSAPDEMVQRRELNRTVSHAISRLSPEMRAVVILHDVEGLTHREISDILRCSEGTVKSRLHHARKKLRRLLKPVLGQVGK